MQNKVKKRHSLFLGILIFIFILLLFNNKDTFNNSPQKLYKDENEKLAAALSQIEGVGEIVIYYTEFNAPKEDSLTQYFSLSNKEKKVSHDDGGGLLIVAEGGGNPKVQNLLLKTVATVLQLPEHKIVIMEMKQGEEPK